MNQTYLGLDVAKNKFDAALRLPDGSLQCAVFANTTAGLRQCAAWLRGHHCQTLTVTLEATGRYWELCAHWLHRHGHIVHLLNPAQARSFAKSQLARNKTDRVDAAILCRLAELAETCQLPCWQPPPVEIDKLQHLSRARAALVRQRATLRQQAAATTDADVRRAFRQAAEALARQVLALDRQLRTHLRAHAALEAKAKLLCSIPGVGEITALLVLGELLPVPLRKVPQVIAYAGLNPRQYQSGTSINAAARLSKIGNVRLRTALFLPALRALHCNPLIQSFGARLAARGKTKMCILGAAMHKLLALIWGVLHQNRPFDPDWLQNRHHLKTPIAN